MEGCAGRNTIHADCGNGRCPAYREARRAIVAFPESQSPQFLENAARGAKDWTKPRAIHGLSRRLADLFHEALDALVHPGKGDTKHFFFAALG